MVLKGLLAHIDQAPGLPGQESLLIHQEILRVLDLLEEHLQGLRGKDAQRLRDLQELAFG